MSGQICDVSRYLASVDAIQVIERGTVIQKKILGEHNKLYVLYCV